MIIMSDKVNYWYSRYYRDTEPVISDPLPADMSVSDALYDMFKGRSIAFIPMTDDISRPVYDSEIAFSGDPSITSRFSAEHRSLLRSAISSQPKSPNTVGRTPSDDDLIRNGAVRHMERDEAVRTIRSNASMFKSDLERFSREHMRAPKPAPESMSQPTTSQPTNTD